MTMTRKDRPVLLYACPTVPSDIWSQAFACFLPEVEMRIWPEIGDPAEIDYAFVWHPPAGVLPCLPRLRAIFSLGAGVESLLANPEIPSGIPLIRMVDPSLAAGMAEFVLMQVLHYHRRMPEVAANQHARLWKPLRPPIAQDRRVGILGFGQLGAHCAEVLARLGFDVAVWARKRHPVAGITRFAGREELAPFFARSEIVICLLPLTPDTLGILNSAAFAAMPPGGFVINVGRGGHLVEADLLAALDQGQLAGATLDVFTVEPLPAEHPFWAHERITVVPHISALTQPRTGVPVIAENIRRDQSRLPLLHVVDRARGY
jgi:glyoxylate/hydroxypyruvate reductase A